MFCSKCGKEISNNENICPNCGYSEYNLIIKRPGKIMGCAINVHITVNNQFFELGAGKSIKLNLPKGTHQVKYKVWCRKEHFVTVDVMDNKVCEVILKYDALLGGFKVSKKSVL